MSGSTLPPPAIVDWLAGKDIARFGVPGDRMPPLSYFLGWAWTKLVGSDPFNHRVLSLSFVTFAAIAIWFAAKRVGGVRGACLATGFFCFSPNIVTIGVEIRAYPFLLTIAAIGFHVLLWGVLGDEKRAAKSVWMLCAAGIAASYTHFFGLVFGGAVLSAALLVSYGQGRALRHVFGAIAVFLVSIAGLWPFIESSVQITGSAADPGAASSLPYLAARLGYRLVAHPASYVSAEFLILYLLGITIIVAGGLSGLKHIGFARTRGGRLYDLSGISRPAVLGFIALLSALVSGVSALVLASFFLSGELVLKPSYNIWLIPGIALLLAAGIGSLRQDTDERSGIRTIVLGSGALCLIAGALGTLVVFSRDMTYFVHGPSAAIRQVVERQPPGTPIYYEMNSEWPHIYFPMFYTYGASLGQFVLERSGDGISVHTARDLEARYRLDDLPKSRRVVLVTAANWGMEEIRRAILDPNVRVETGPALSRLLADPRWKVVSDRSFASFVAARIVVAERTD